MTLAEWLDVVVAVAAVAGVVVAAVLGSQGLKEARRSAEVSRRSVEIADRTLRRAELDAACQRADVVNDALGVVIQQHGSVRAEMHPYWKRPDRPVVQPDGTVYTGPEEEVLSSAEAATHKAIYSLEGAAAVLRSSIKALGHYPSQKDNEVELAIAWTEVVNRSVFPSYQSLIPENPFGKPEDAGSLALGARPELPDPLTWLNEQLDLDRSVARLVKSDIERWCTDFLRSCKPAAGSSAETASSSFDALEREMGSGRVVVHMSTFTDAFAVWALEQLEDVVEQAVQRVYREASESAHLAADEGQDEPSGV